MNGLGAGLGDRAGLGDEQGDRDLAEGVRTCRSRVGLSGVMGVLMLSCLTMAGKNRAVSDGRRSGWCALG